MNTILIVEDHENLRSSLESCLKSEGFDTIAVDSLRFARSHLEMQPDLILLDWMLPDGQGIDLLKELRKQHYQTPVILLTARADTLDKVLGLELGANDYITKPFEPRELVARIRTRLREASSRSVPQAEPDSALKVGSLVIDKLKRRVMFKNREIELVKKEYELLQLFADNPEKVFSRDEILNKVWGYEVYPTTRTVDTHVMLLRQKVDERIIETIRSVGYKFKPV